MRFSLTDTIGADVRAALETEAGRAAALAYGSDRNPRTLRDLKTALVAAGVRPHRLTKKTLDNIAETRRWAGAENRLWKRGRRR